MQSRIIFTLFFVAQAFVCTKAQQIMFDSLEQVNILVGNMDKSSISDSSWYLENYSIDYPSTEKVKMIEKYSNSASVEVYFGSWCSDSYTWVPAFLKIAENTSLGKELSIIGLPKDLAKREAYATGKNILKVPTFVFMRNGVEIGRIIESPIENLSDDIIKILVSR